MTIASTIILSFVIFVLMAVMYVVGKHDGEYRVKMKMIDILEEMGKLESLSINERIAVGSIVSTVITKLRKGVR